ncbi:MAG: hypothetical protein AB2662_17355 [Candidatus Thiodiazotropha sp.]
MKLNKQVKSFRLHPADLKKLREVSEEQGVSQTTFLERALHREFWRFEQQVKQAV